MDLIKIGIIIAAWIIVSLVLAVVIPPFKENKTYPCVFNGDKCSYPNDANMAFWGAFVFTCFVFIIIGALQFFEEVSNAYIMTLPEAWSKISLSNRMMYNIPSVDMLVPEMTKDIENGKKKQILYYNPLDGYRRHILTLNMMSDYNTTTTATKQFDPVISFTRMPLSLPMQKSMLYSPEKDMVSKVAQLERQLERQGFNSLPRDVLDDKVESEKEKLKQVSP